MMSTNSNRLIGYHIGRLKDKNRDVRLKSIRELELLNASDALEALRAVYETDTDEEVRREAQQAGRKIYLNTRNAESQ